MRFLPLAAALVVLALPASAGAIVGGQPATREYSHMGALLYDAPGGQQSYSFECGASLVAPQYVLTAAHCVTEDDGSVSSSGSLRVQLGSHKLSRPGETLAVTQVAREPEYDNGTAAYDLALLRLERPAHETPIAIAGPAQRALWAPGAKATVIGWGTQVWPDLAGATVSDDLREVEVPFQSDGDCAQWSVMVSYDPKTMVCAGETTGGKDACNGDSGGPLMSIGAGGALTLVGVVSQGTGCGYPTQYGVYARVGEGPLRAWLDGALPRPPAPVAQAASTTPAASTAPAGQPAAAPKPTAKPKAKARPKKKARRKHHKKRRRRRSAT